MVFPVVQEWVDRLHELARGRTIVFKIVSFGLVGITNTAIDLSVFSIGYYLLGMPIIAANMLSWIVAASWSYLLNSSITFSIDSRHDLSVRRYFVFLLAQSAGFAANTATVVIASRYMPVLFGKMLAVAVSFMVNFSLSHFVIFRRSAVDI